MQIVPIRPRTSGRGRLLELLDEESRWSFLRAPAGFDKVATVQAWLNANPRRLKAARWIEVVSTSRVDAVTLTALLAGEGRVKTLVLDATLVRHPLDLSALHALGVHAHHVVVLARSPHTLPDHLSAALEARLIDAKTLSYRDEEIAALIPDIDAPSALRIMEATAGWPMLVRLVAARHPHTSLNLSRMATSFAEEQLTQLSPLAVTVMQAMCVATEPSTALTVELSGLTAEEAGRGWAEVAAEGLAMTQDVGGDIRWRVVPLVRGAILARSNEESPDRVRELHRRAARWFAQHSQPVEAARHAIAAEDWDMAIDVIEDAAFMLFAEHPAAARELVNGIPLNLIENRPVARVLHDLFLTAGGSEAQFTAAVTAHGQRRQFVGPEHVHDLLRRPEIDEGTIELSWRAAIHKRHEGDFEGALAIHTALSSRLADRTWTMRPTTRAFLPLLYLQSGISSLLAGCFVDAERELINATRDGKAGFGAFSQRNAFADLALIAGVEGDIPRAKENLIRMGQRPSIIGFWARVVRFGELVTEATVATERLEFETARAALAIAAESADRDELWAFYLLARARLAVADGSAVSALSEISALRRTRAHLAGTDSAAAFLLPWAEAELLLAIGQAARAGEVLDAVPRHPLLAGIRVLQRLQVGEPAEAIALAGPVLWTDEAGPIARALGFLARAAAELQLNQREDAATSFRFAHKLVTRFDHRRILGLLPRETLDALTELTGLTVELNGIPEMLPKPVPYVSLTERELIVLRHLTTGATVGGIAQKLFVSENTVRTQVQAMYRKLAVHNRNEAVAEALRRGITS